MTTDHTPPAADTVRDQLLHALDFAYCQGIGYQSPEELLAAYDASRTPPAAELAQRLGAIRQQMANTATDRPTPQQLADWDEFDRNMAARIQKARPGIPLHHAYATLQTLRAIQQAEAPTAVLPPPVSRADVLPAWEAVYEPGNVSDYLIGYANDQDPATGMAEAWLRSQAEVTGRLEWVDDKQMATGRYDRWFELIERHDDGVDTGPGIIVRRRMADEAQPGTEAPAEVEHCVHDRAVHQQHHHTPVDGCPWCAASVEARP